MDANKPWTMKPREDKVDASWEDKRNTWEDKRNTWQFKNQHRRPWEARQTHDQSTPQGDDHKTVISQQPKESLNEKNEDKPTTVQQTYTGSNSFMASRKCYFCGGYGHFSRYCPKKTQVHVAQVPSLYEGKDKALTVPGKIGHTTIPDMLCDSGATISVIAQHLVPPETTLQEEVWIETLDGPAKPYPTALVEAQVNNKTIELFAAVLPAQAMPYPVILGRYIPGMTVTWSMTVGNDKEIIFQLQQDTCSSEPASTVTKKATKIPDKAVQPEEEAVAGEPTSQVVEEKADTVPLSRSGKEMWPGKANVCMAAESQSTPPAAETQEEISYLEIFPVTTRAQSKRRLKEMAAHEQATAQSGVVITKPQEQDQGATNVCDDAGSDGPSSPAQPSDCEENKRPELKEEIVITQQQLLHEQLQDEETNKFREEALDCDSQFLIKQDILYWKQHHNSHSEDQDQALIVVPTVLRKPVLQAGHDLAGHFGSKKSKTLIQAHFWWPGMGRDIVQYCKACPICLKFNHKKTRKEPLCPLPVITRPWSRIAIDIVGKFQRTKRGNAYILTIMDFATRYMEAIPLPRIDAATTCDALLEVFARFGIPDEVLSDNGTNFVAQLSEEFLKLFKIHHIKTSPFHPQTNGMLERSHQTMKKTLDKLGSSTTNWDQYLAPTLMALRTAPHAALGMSPFQLLFGREARTPVSALREGMEQVTMVPKNVLDYLEDLYDKMEKTQALVQERDLKAKQESKKLYDRGSQQDPLEPGDMVMVMVPKGLDSLTCHWQGPCKILRKLSETTYLVDTPQRSGKKTTKCHRNMLKRHFLQVLSATVMLAADEEGLAEVTLDSQQTDMTDIQMPAELSNSKKEDLKAVISQFQDVFRKTPGEARVKPFKINTGDAKPVSQYPRRLPEKWKQKIQKEIKTLEATGIITPSTSPWASPIVPVPKPNGDVRMCVDYRGVNKVTEEDIYPLPRVDHLLEEVSQAKYVTTLDLLKGYYQFPVSPEDKQKTAFVTPTGKWQFNRMPFGLKGAPAAFQREIDSLFQDQENICAYIDDVAIYSQTWDQHLRDIAKALSLLREKGLTVNVAKCKFAQQEVELLGHVVGGGKLKTQQAKILAIARMPSPKTKKELQSFLGSTGYYRKFIPYYSERSACLSDLTRKMEPDKLNWTETHQTAFDHLKDALSRAPVLIAPDYSKPFSVSTDASGVGVGGVLEQTGQDGELRPIAFFSKKLLAREKRYGITELEALAIYKTVKHFAPYLIGNKTTVWTDHRALTFMDKMKDASSRVNRWILELQQYDLDVKYKKGPENCVADALSRNPADSSSTYTGQAQSLEGGGGVGQPTAPEQPGL